MTSLFRNAMLNIRRTAWRWVPGLVAANVTLIGIELGVFQSLQSLANNILFQMRGAIEWDERVVVVEIDDQSIQALGQFPIERHHYTEFLQRMDEAQPSVIAFDIVFAEPGEDDEAFAAAINHLNRVVLAQSWDKKGTPLLPTPILAEHAVNTGHVLHRPDTDGISRSVQSYVQSVPSLGVAIAQSYALIAEPVHIPENPYPDEHHLWINWPGPSHEASSYSFYDVLKGSVSPNAFQDKIVILGVTASGDSPLLTPFNRNPPTGGVYLQAAVVSNLLQRNALHRTGMGWQMILLVLGGPVLGVCSSYRGCRRRWVSWVGLSVGWTVLGVLCLQSNWLIPVVWPITLVTMTIGLTEATERLRATAYLQAEVERLWAAHHGDLISAPDPHSLSKPAHAGHVDGTGRRISSHPVAVQRAMQLAELADLFGRSQSLHAAIARHVSIGLIAADWDGSVWLCNPVASNIMEGTIGASLAQTFVPDWLTLDDWNAYTLSLCQSDPPCWEVQKGNAWFEFKLEPLFYSQPPNAQPPNAQPPNVLQEDDVQPCCFNASDTQAVPHGLSDTSQMNGYSPNSDHTHRRSASEGSGNKKGTPNSHPSPAGSASFHHQPTGVLVIIQDITAFKHVEAEIRSALAEATELSALKTRFVSMASHELRTPLTVIRTSIELLRAYGPSIAPEKHQDYLARMQASLNTMKSLIEDVLTLGKAENRCLECHPNPVTLDDFCQHLINQLQPDALSSGRIQLTLNTQHSQWLLDQNLLSLILNNLLSNALKYSPDDTCVDLTVVENEGSITFEVRDRGIGIPENDQKHLFEEFQRAGNVGSIPGTGLGLSIVKRCVELHGGTITIDSHVGVGTTSRVTFYAHTPEPVQAKFPI